MYVGAQSASECAGTVVSLEQRLVAVGLKDGQDIPDANLRKALTDAGCLRTAPFEALNLDVMPQGHSPQGPQAVTLKAV
jgi:hypothetical protein